MGTELTLFRYALASWNRAPDVPSNTRAFSYHRKSGVSALFGALILATVAETVPAHIMVRQWSERVAWLLTALSIVAIVWLVGFLRAIRLRPVLVMTDEIIVRCGIRWCVRIPRAAIVDIRTGFVKTPPKGTPGLARATVATQPNVVLELDRAVVVEGMYGLTSEATSVAFRVDEPEEFRACLSIR